MDVGKPFTCKIKVSLIRQYRNILSWRETTLLTSAGNGSIANLSNLSITRVYIAVSHFLRNRWEGEPRSISYIAYRPIAFLNSDSGTAFPSLYSFKLSSRLASSSGLSRESISTMCVFIKTRSSRIILNSSAIPFASIASLITGIECKDKYCCS